MPEIHNRRGLGLLIWEDGDIAVFATFEDAVDALNQLCWALEINNLILESY